MKLALQVTARDLPLTDAIDTAIRNKALKLTHFFDRIISCRVVVHAPHRHHHKGKSYHVDIDIHVPGAELIVKREPHEDLYIAIRDAFDAARRQLQGYVCRQRREVKLHDVDLPARISHLEQEQGYGFITTIEGREIYFHRNSLTHGRFEKLRVGTFVRYAEAQGEQGPQASALSMT